MLEGIGFTLMQGAVAGTSAAIGGSIGALTGPLAPVLSPVLAFTCGKFAKEVMTSWLDSGNVQLDRVDSHTASTTLPHDHLVAQNLDHTHFDHSTIDHSVVFDMFN